jgi:phage terminase Nu1 subunit (DNA packaging protein)
VWAPRKVPNPAYFLDTAPALRLAPVGAVAVEVWTTNGGILFDGFAAGTSLDTVFAAAAGWEAKHAAEIAAEEAERAAESARARDSKLAGGGLREQVEVALADAAQFALDQAAKQPAALAAAALLALLSIAYLLFAGPSRAPRRRTKETAESEPSPAGSTSAVVENESK